MGSSQSSPRKITVINDEATGVIKASHTLTIGHVILMKSRVEILG